MLRALDFVFLFNSRFSIGFCFQATETPHDGSVFLQLELWTSVYGLLRPNRPAGLVFVGLNAYWAERKSTIGKCQYIWAMILDTLG